MFKSTRKSLSWVLGLGSILFFQAYSSASASCLYNHTDKTIEMHLGCGWVCSNVWYIKPGDHKCRGGVGGLVSVSGGVPKHGTIQDLEFLHVEDHGYVTVVKGFKGKMEYDTICSYKQDHSLRGACAPLLAPNGGI